ncbi:capsular polysaccharide biosynthesis protein [Shimia marina]|uniref:Capsule polysaccharide biosynthesis protein n=1 Tax=Shimia marina TaxID=321267 RepID=A0A0N7LRY7_9RHOB|nr:capsular polysaccharide biosynthesis protein [Shimia marina]CUH52132.1 Capsule polysaccharide biosynthesis protein [Shimia marina]SFE64620.1 capsular polysaccharide export protein [Shimia marina]
MTSRRQLLNTYFPEHTGKIAGWGAKPSATRARFFAALTKRQAVFLEDGFLRSFGRDDAPLSLLCDTCGIYYDARSPSTLEKLIAQTLTDSERARAERVARLWRQHDVSKYNHLPEWEHRSTAPYVLLFDQVAGDKSISCGLASPASFRKMFKDAQREHPGKQLLIKTHPDVVRKRKKGHFDLDALALLENVTVIADAVHPVAIIRGADAVYTVTSQTGFEALLHGVPVRTYGVPFYAGWGLTEDRASHDTPDVAEALSRRHPVPFASLVHAALITYPAYRDPTSGQVISPEEAISQVGAARKRVAMRGTAVHALGFSLWKKPILRRFMHPAQVTFHETAATVPGGATVVLWGAHDASSLPSNTRIMRLEDGFIRSKGLGADLNAPGSWILDDLGIYFDSTQPSRLEHILQHQCVSPDDITEARAVRDTVLSKGITKYNLHGREWHRPSTAKRVLLVPGQVESDASIRLGSPIIKSNLALVKAVRAANPDAYVLYKPHPDVESGHRSRGASEDDIPAFCDEVLTQGSIAALFDQVDEVHTMTSLSGFEALMRGLKVTCYGQPFYSGWGLTTDIHPQNRRTRTRNLDELVYAALIAYPDYMSLKSGTPTSAQNAIEEIASYKPSRLRSNPLRRKLTRTLALLAEKKRTKGWAT